MSTFVTPTDDFVFWAERGSKGIMSHLKPGVRGRNVYKLTSGLFTESDPYDPTVIDTIYHGGHVHTVVGTEETDLITGGYGGYVS